MQDCLLEDRHGAAAVLTLNRPAARNAINTELTHRLDTALGRLDADETVRVVILTGVPPVFCAGADLKEVREGRIKDLEAGDAGFAGLITRRRGKPLIAAVDGPALAGGCEIVLSADLVVASTSASFGLPEVKRSLVAGAGGMFRLGRKIPMNIAMECLLTGSPITAEAAFRFGLVNRLCEPGAAVATALELGLQLSSNAPLAVELTRKAALETTFADDQTAWRRTRDAMAQVLDTHDMVEGVTAFIDKRQAQWNR
jgi:enoyl-CoA hydratase